MQNNKAIFLDRDGTLNTDNGYTYKLSDLNLLPGVKEGLNQLKGYGYKLIIITNQSGIGRGYYTLEDCINFIIGIENEIGISFDGVYICPHKPDDNCKCRKPCTLHIDLAKKKFGLNLKNCYLIGDKETDIICGKQSGCKTIYVGTDKIKTKPDYIFKTILEFTKTLG